MALGPSMILFGHGPPLVLEVDKTLLKEGLGEGSSSGGSRQPTKLALFQTHSGSSSSSASP